MRKIGILAGIVAMLGGLSVAPAFAAPQTLWVSQGGSDATGTGAFFNPYRTLSKALTVSNDGDTIQLEQGDYSPGGVIQDAVIILAPPGGGIFGPPGAPCLIVNASAGDDILIDGLTCNQGGAAQNGIVFNTGHKLTLHDTTIRGNTGPTCGVNFKPNANAELNVEDSFFQGGSSGAGGGICISPVGGADVTGVLDNIALQNSPFGLRSVAPAGSINKLTLTNSTISENGGGVFSSGATSTVSLSNSMITNNTSGLQVAGGGKIVSLQGNSLTGNTVNGVFTSTVPKQ